jgi:hypothetical protein
VQVVATDYVRLLPSVQAFAADGADISGGGSSAGAAPQPFNTSYSVALPGGQAGRCLNSAGGDGGLVQTLAAPGDADGVYCGPVELGSGSGDGGGSQGASDDGSSAAAAAPEAGTGGVPPPLEGMQEAGSSGRAATHTLPVAALLAAAVAVALALPV